MTSSLPFERDDARQQFESGVVVLSLDTEQIWGYSDQLDETQFREQYPNALDAQQKVLDCLSRAGVSATWFMVGGMALRGSAGTNDLRMAGLPEKWTSRIPCGIELTAPLWYRHSFVDRLRKARPFQEVGLHGGLTHLIWTDACATREVVRRELAAGVNDTGVDVAPLTTVVGVSSFPWYNTTRTSAPDSCKSRMSRRR